MTIQEQYGLLIVIALMVAYSAYFSALSIQRHNTFRTYASDMGQMDQALWNTLHGNLLEDTRDNGDRTARQAPRLTDHVEPIFLAVSLVFLVYDGIESLFVVQSIAVALGALPIFWIARRRLKSDWAATLFAAMYLLFPALQAANLAEFHAVTFAPAPLLLAYNYAEERAWKRYALFALLALAVKEDMALLVFAMAVWAAVQSTVNSQLAIFDGASTDKRIRIHVLRFTFYVSLAPLIIALVSVAWFAIALYVIVPSFSPRNESVYIGRYPQSPLAILAGLFIPEKLGYVVGLLASGGFIALLDPVALLVGAPSLVLNLLSSYPAQYSGTYHYSAPVAPYFVLAAIGGAGVIRNSKFVIQTFKSLAPAVVIVPAFLVALGYHVLAGYTPIGGEYFWPESTPHQQQLARFVKQIPLDARVSTTKTLFPHVSHRRYVYRFPTIQDADYILLDVSQSVATNAVDFRVNYLEALQQGFGVRDALDGYVLLERGLAQNELPDGFYTFLRACPCALIQNRVQIDFEDKIRFLGYDVRQDDWQRVYLRTYWTRLPGMDANNYAFYPFFADESGALREDAVIPPLLVQFWYPTMRWLDGEVVVADTLPVDLGTRAKIGLGVFFGATWETAERRLEPHTAAPISSEWVWIGNLARVGKKYQILP
ncbi:MAG: DUF2079 domain-containing protein [Chloroflexi bacterium]|nr:DUF2079 domain-containing protein [Chloroflexota bacterium]